MTDWETAAKEEARLFARADELLARARAGEVVCTAFLTPREQKRLSCHLAHAKSEWVLEGGYASAERRRMFFLPEYIVEAAPDIRTALFADDLKNAFVALSITGSGYRTLTHRDFLGALLNLGIKREAIGDVCLLSPYCAVCFCDIVMAAFLTENLRRVANDVVSVSRVALAPDFDGGRTFEPVTDTVASPRVDAVVAALCHLSRDKAQALFARDLVEVDYEIVRKYDREVTANTVLTVRGYGKFKIRSLSDQTKKGRYRLLAERYI